MLAAGGWNVSANGHHFFMRETRHRMLALPLPLVLAVGLIVPRAGGGAVTTASTVARLRGGGASAQDVMSPFDLSELRAMGRAAAADPDIDFVGQPPLFRPRTPDSADSSDDANDLMRPRRAAGIHEGDVHSHSCRATQAPKAPGLAEQCMWCNEEWQKSVKLLKAARLGDLEGVLHAIDDGANINAVDKMYMNWTAVHYAAFYGHASLVERLVDFGADLDARDLLLWTPLHYAALKGRADACDALLHCGADVMALTKHGKTPLQKAVYTYQIDATRVLCEWMGIPADDFLAEEPPDPALLQQAISLDNQESRTALLRKRDLEPSDSSDEGMHASSESKQAAAEADPQETVGLQPERTKEEAEDTAKFRAEYMRRFRETHESERANPAFGH